MKPFSLLRVLPKRFAELKVGELMPWMSFCNIQWKATASPVSNSNVENVTRKSNSSGCVRKNSCATTARASLLPMSGASSRL